MTDSRLLIPVPDPVPWPSLGGPICDFIEDQLVHGPGDLLGDPITLDDEFRFFIWRAYEVYPKGHRREGRRRFKRAVLSRRKGVGKTELAALIAICEFDPSCPVRFDGWRKVGGTFEPVGRPVRDPYIPMLATTEQQTEDLAYGAVYAILTQDSCPLVNEYDAGLERIAHAHAPGKIVALAGAPNARDGARTTFQHFDETHLFTSDRLVKAHATMLRNIPKRPIADPWTFETTTAYAPGEDSVAEGTFRYADEVRRGKIADPTLLYDHRQASEGYDLEKKRQFVAAIREASGDAWERTDVSAIAALKADPTVSENDLRRYWLNQNRRSSVTWGPSAVWEGLKKRRRLDERAKVVLAFCGTYDRSATALVGCTVEDRPHLFVVDAWERPMDQTGWRTPRLGVEGALERAMDRYDVVEFAPDPVGWHREVEEWEATYGDTVVRFEAARQPSRYGPACDDFEQGCKEAELTQDGSEVLGRHLANCAPQDHRSYTIAVPGVPGAPIAGARAAVVAFHRAHWHATNVLEPLVAWV